MAEHETAPYRGEVTAVRGSVVDVVFAEAIPPLHALLRAVERPAQALEVVDHVDPTTVRCIALTPTADDGRRRTLANAATGSRVAVAPLRCRWA